jgi:NaMN:DMB phosphoribosyltransferase
VLAALGYIGNVCSSASTNPLELKRQVVCDALKSSGIKPGDLRENPMEAIRCVGDPMMAAVAGIAAGLEDVPVILAGGTQMATIFGVIKHLGYKTDNITIVQLLCYELILPPTLTAAEKLDAKAYATDPDSTITALQGLRQYEAGFVKRSRGRWEQFTHKDVWHTVKNLVLRSRFTCEKLSKYGDIVRVK